MLAPQARHNTKCSGFLIVRPTCINFPNVLRKQTIGKIKNLFTGQFSALTTHIKPTPILISVVLWVEQWIACWNTKLGEPSLNSNQVPYIQFCAITLGKIMNPTALTLR